jgi:hypothetical protein
MPKAKLHRSLRDLNDEIEKTETDDEEAQAVLDEMKTHVEKVLDDLDGPYHLDLPDPLERAYILFEHDYPSLAKAIKVTINSLSAMGI